MVESLVGHPAVDHHPLRHAGGPARPVAGPQDAARQEGLDLPGVAHHRQLLLVPAALGEHAEIEGGPDPVVVLDDDEGVVEDVRPLAAVALVEVVDVLAAGGEDPGRPAGGHQATCRSKKWQHFSTRVPPVFRLNRFQSPTLARKGKRCSRTATMRTRPTAPDGHLVDEGGHRRHVAVLEADPDHAGVVPRPLR